MTLLSGKRHGPSSRMMIIGRQIRDARQMLGWSPAVLAAKADLSADVIARAEAMDDTPGIMLDQGRRLRDAFEQAGLRFGHGVGVARRDTVAGPTR